jgi:prepilin-type N-terminal cleavage/methylation domain-containing protein
MTNRAAAEGRREAGFSLLEVLVTLTIFVVSGSIGMPALLNYLQRAKLEGAARETVMMLHATRLEAITRGAPTVVAIDEDSGDLVAFADVDGEDSLDPPDGIFNPVTGDRYRETDYELGRLRLPNGVRFADPDGNLGVDSVAGFENPAPLPDRIVYFQIDGTVADDGALRVADLRGNFLEARIAATTTARVEIRKWDGTIWREQGEEEGAWVWQ